MKAFRHYLYGRPFLIRTDHGALTWLLNFKEPEGKVARWLSTLGTYDYRITHRAGTKHGNADGLSRQRRRCKRSDCPECGKHSSSVGDAVRIGAVTAANTSSENAISNWLNSYTLEDIKRWQTNDPHISVVINWLNQSTEKPDSSSIMHEATETKRYISQWNMLKLLNGILYREWVPEKGEGVPFYQLCAPLSLRREIFENLHCLRTSGHLGSNRTFKSIRSRFYWPGFKGDIIQWCKFCKICACTKMSHGKHQGHLKQLLCGAPMERIAVDFIGPLPMTENGNEHLLVVSDYFTKWVECFPLPNQRADTTADALVTQFFSRFGAPLIIHSDQGRDFESNLFSEMCKLYGIKKTRTTPYHPRSDGMVERFNRTIQQMLKAYVNEHRNDWDEHVPYLTMAYRATVHDSTGYSPNRLMLGREISLPIDVMFGKPKSALRPCYTDYVNWFSEVTEEAFEFARQHLQTAAKRQKRNFDVGIKPTSFKARDLVWYFYPPKSRKLETPWLGPYSIIKVLNNSLYEIRSGSSSRSKIVHVDNLRPYVTEDSENSESLPNSESPDPTIDFESNAELSELPFPSSDTTVDAQDVGVGHRLRRRPAYLKDYL